MYYPILIIQAITAYAMLGIVFYMQLIHYPLYLKIKQGFERYERAHVKRSAYLIGPLMLVELLTAFGLVTYASSDFVTRLSVFNLILIIATWIVTFLLSMPQHQRLSAHRSEKKIHQLINSNWLRSLFTLARAVLITFLIVG